MVSILKVSEATVTLDVSIKMKSLGVSISSFMCIKAKEQHECTAHSPLRTVGYQSAVKKKAIL